MKPKMKAKIKTKMIQYKLTAIFNEYAGSLQSRFNAFVFGVVPESDAAEYERYANEARKAYTDNSIDIADVAKLLSYFENGNGRTISRLSRYKKGIGTVGITTYFEKDPTKYLPFIKTRIEACMTTILHENPSYRSFLTLEKIELSKETFIEDIMYEKSYL